MKSPIIFMQSIAIVGLLFLASSPLFAQFTTVINIPPDPNPSGRMIGSDTQLNLMDGGFLAGSSFRPFEIGLEDGTGSNVEVNMLGGDMGRTNVNGGSVVNISAGSIDYGFIVHAGATANVSGGKFDGLFRAHSGSTVKITGGILGDDFQSNSGSHVTHSGGTYGVGFTASNSSDVTFTGGEYQLNGEPISDTSVNLGSTDVLSGTFEDGAPFVFTPIARDEIRGVKLISMPLPSIDTTPILLNYNSDLIGLRRGQTLYLDNGGVLGKNFAAVDAFISLLGGDTG